jgi:hypothetical protein
MLSVMLTASFPFRRPQDSKVQGVKRMQLMFERILNADFQPIPYVSCPNLAAALLYPIACCSMTV